MQKIRWIVGLAVVLSTTAAAPLAAAEAAPCVVSGTGSAGLDLGPRDADGIYGYQKWLVSDTGQAVAQTLTQTQAAVMGVPDTASTDMRLQRGFIGYATDHATHTMVAVVTPEYANVSALTTALTTARNLVAAGQASAPGVRVQKGCFTADQLIGAESVLRQRSWHPDAAAASYAYALRADDSRFHVTFDERFPAAAEALAAVLGDRAVVELGVVARSGRLNDGEPHYGGSGIRKNYNSSLSSNQCTSGFTVRRKSDGRRGVTTAGHCFSNGDSIYSSTQFAGVLWGEGTVDNPYPAIDVAGILSSSETYANIIHVEPCSPCVRTVIGKSTVGGGSTICTSGMVTTAICSVLVTSVNSGICDAAGCTFDLIEGWRNGDTVVRAGDSGGPAYIRSGASSATAVGAIVGGAGGRTSTSTTVLIEPIAVVEEALGVTVATS
jgi:hypothetical protein